MVGPVGSVLQGRYTMDRTATCVPTAVDAPSSTSLSLSAPLSTSAPVVLPHTAIPAAPGHTLPQPSPPLPLPPQQQHPLKPQHQPQHQPQQQEQPQHGSQRHTDQGSSDDRVATRAAPPRPPRRRHVIASRRSSRARTSSPDHCHSAASGRPADGGDAVACEAGGASDNTNKRVSAGGQLHAMKPTRTRTKANTPAPSKRRHVSAPLLPFRRPTSTVFRLRKELGLASCRLSARIGGGGGGGGGGVGSHAHTVSDGAATASATVVVANTASVGPPGGHNNVSGHAGKGAMGDRSSSSAAAPKAVGAGATSVLSAGKRASWGVCCVVPCAAFVLCVVLTVSVLWRRRARVRVLRFCVCDTLCVCMCTDVGKWLWSSSETLRSRVSDGLGAVVRCPEFGMLHVVGATPYSSPHS